MMVQDPNRNDTPSSSVGLLVPNSSARIMNEDGTAEVKLGERGELWIKGPNIMGGYWNNEKATKETLTDDGWLKTGDVAYVDDEGLFYIVDRKKVGLMKYDNLFFFVAASFANAAIFCRS